MKILLAAYSCGAGRGSEPGVGWNIARGLSLRGHDVTVITNGKFSEQNHQAVAAENLSLKLVEQRFRKPFFKWRSSYYRWQKKIGDIIRSEAEKGHYDVIHHITFNQYRGLFDVFYTPLPLLIGPVGGAEMIAPYFLRYGKMPPGMVVKELLRYVAADALPVARRFNAARQRKLFVASNPVTATRFNKGLFALQPSAVVYPIIAVNEADILPGEPQRKQPYFLFDGGIARPQKGTWLMLDALALLWQRGCCVPVRMVGTKEEDKAIIRRYMAKKQLPEQAVEMLPPVPHEEMLGLMQHSLALLSTVFRDSGGMAILEAVAQGTNAICFDIPSQKWLPDTLACKVRVPRLGEGAAAAAQAVADTMQRVAAAPEHDAAWHAERCRFLSGNMTWTAHLTAIENMYRQLLEP